MLDHTEVVRLAAASSEIGEAVADTDGFVPMRALLKQFRAELVAS